MNLGGLATKPWQQEMTVVAILYRIAECDEQIPIVPVGTDHVFITPALTEMAKLELIDTPNNTQWAVTEKGKGVLAKMVAMLDQVQQFEIFGAVNFAVALTKEQADAESAGQVKAGVYDPRFQEAPGCEDMRIAMMTYFSAVKGMKEKIGGAIDPYRVVFLQKLGANLLQGKNFWIDLQLGTFFKEIEAIVDSAYKWTDAGSDIETASDNMSGLYAAGQLERQKREGCECSACGIPLALAMQPGVKLEACPMCNASFTPPPAATLACPNCDHDILPRQRKCRGCGAKIDRSLAPGTVTNVTTTTTTVEESYAPIWGYDYGYVPYGYYSPYDPFVDALAFGVLCAVLW